MSALTQKLDTSGVVTVEPVRLKPGHAFAHLNEAMDLFCKTLRTHRIATGFLGGFVIIDNLHQDGTQIEESNQAEQTILLSFFWKSQDDLENSQDNALYQVLLDDVLTHCQSPEGHDLRAPGLVTELFQPRYEDAPVAPKSRYMH